MAHFIKLNQLDLNHDSTQTYTTILFNLDNAVSIVPSPRGNHSVIVTDYTGSIIRVKENLEEIQSLINRCCDDTKRKQLND